MYPPLQETELDRIVDQSLGWSPRVPVARVVGDKSERDRALAGFVDRRTPRFYQVGRRGSRTPVYLGVTRGRSVADCVAEHLTGTTDGRPTARSRRLALALRRTGDPAGLWVTQAPVTATAVDPADALSVQATLLLLQSCLGAEVVNPGDPAALPRSVRSAGRGPGDQEDEGEAMAFAGMRRRLRQLAAAGGLLLGLNAPPGEQGKAARAVTELVETAVSDGERKRRELAAKTRSAADATSWRDRPPRRRP